MSDTLAERLRQARERVQLSQSDLARRVGISPQAVQHIEAGKTKRTRYINALAEALNVQPSWLENNFAEHNAQNSVANEYLDLSRGRDQLLTGKQDEHPYPGNMAVPTEIVAYDENVIPVLIGWTVSFFSERTNRLLQDKLLTDTAEWITPDPEEVSGAPSNLVERDLLFINALEWRPTIPRPYYLDGKVGAYALYIGRPTLMRPRITGREILYIDPHMRVRPGDLALLWFHNSTFIPCEFIDFDDAGINFRITAPTRFAVRRFSMPLQFCKAIHVIAGWEAVSQNREVLNEYRLQRLRAVRGQPAEQDRGE